MSYYSKSAGTLSRRGARFTHPSGMPLAIFASCPERHHETQALRTMAGIVGLNGEAPVQVKLTQRLMLEQTLMVADRMVAGLEGLYAQFPSDELREAMLDTLRWRDELRDRTEGQFSTNVSN